VHHIRLDRLLKRREQMAAIGALPGGGVTRLALSDEDRAARRLFETWAGELAESYA